MYRFVGWSISEMEEITPKRSSQCRRLYFLQSRFPASGVFYRRRKRDPQMSLLLLRLFGSRKLKDSVSYMVLVKLRCGYLFSAAPPLGSGSFSADALPLQTLEDGVSGFSFCRVFARLQQSCSAVGRFIGSSAEFLLLGLVGGSARSPFCSVRGQQDQICGLQLLLLSVHHFLSVVDGLAAAEFLALSRALSSPVRVSVHLCLSSSRLVQLLLVYVVVVRGLLFVASRPFQVLLPSPLSISRTSYCGQHFFGIHVLFQETSSFLLLPVSLKPPGVSLLRPLLLHLSQGPASAHSGHCWVCFAGYCFRFRVKGFFGGFCSVLFRLTIRYLCFVLCACAV